MGLPRLHLLESKPYVAGGNVQVSLRDLPPGKRIRAFFLRFEGLFTQSAAPALASGDALAQIFQNIELGKRIKVTGAYLDRLNWLMRGGQMSLPADVPATASTAFRRTLTSIIPFMDPFADSKGDGCPLTDFFRDTPLIVDFAGSALFPTITIAGTLRTYAVLDEADEGVVPSALQMGYTDWTGSQVFLEPGLYTHAWAYKETGGVITNAEITSISATIDGDRVIDLVRAEELAVLNDYYFANGAALRATSATVPVPGEQFTDEPAYTGGAASTVSLEFAPILMCGPNYKLTQAFLVEKTMRLDFQGSLNQFRIGWRRFEPRSAEQAIKAMVKAGIPNPDPARIEAKTASKAGLSPARAKFMRFLPLRHR